MIRIAPKDAQAGLFQVLFNVQKFVNESGLEHSLITLIKMRASQINQCAYCIDMHSKDGIAEGETLQRLVSLSAWKETPYYSPRERAALLLTDVLTNLANDPDLDGAYEEVEKHFTKAEISVLVVAISQINTWNRVARTFGTPAGSYEIASVKA